MLMSSVESRSGRNRYKMVVYSKEKLSTAATSRKWNRVTIRCIQKYDRDSQFGLRTISFFTETRDQSSTVLDRGVTSPLSQRPLATTPTSAGLAATPKQEVSHDSTQRQKFPPTPQSSRSEGGTPHEGRLKWTPRRSRVVSESNTSEKDYEFSGIEKQSRLFRNCLQRKPDDSDSTLKGSNQILDRISAEKEKYRDALSQYPRKRLLKREIPKVEVMKDFVESYRESKDKKQPVELAGACRKMSSHGETHCVCVCVCVKCMPFISDDHYHMTYSVLSG
jgi:hypothetical protein